MGRLAFQTYLYNLRNQTIIYQWRTISTLAFRHFWYLVVYFCQLIFLTQQHVHHILLATFTFRTMQLTILCSTCFLMLCSVVIPNIPDLNLSDITTPSGKYILVFPTTRRNMRLNHEIMLQRNFPFIVIRLITKHSYKYSC